MAAGTAGQILRLAFEHALKASRNVRANARGTSHADSVAAASIEIISENPIPMTELIAVVVGAGNTGALAARLLTERGVRNITIANRSVDRAREVAKSVGGNAIGLTDLASVLNHADVVISSTGAPHHVITSDDLIRAGVDQRVHPMTIIDMAVPNDVEPSASSLPGVDLYDIYRIGDSLRHKSPDSAFACEGDAFAAIQEQVIHFETGSRAARRGALIQNVVAESKSVRDTELERATRALKRQGIDTQCLLPVLDAMANSIANKLLHASITHIRESESEDSALAVMQLFGNRIPQHQTSPTTSALAA